MYNNCCIFRLLFRQRSKSLKEPQPSSTTEVNSEVKQVSITSTPSDVHSGCVENITPERDVNSSTEPSEHVTNKVKPPMLGIITRSTEDSDLPPLPPTPGRVVRMFTNPQAKSCSSSTDEMLAIMGAVDGQQESNQETIKDRVNPSIHKLLTNPEMMSFKFRRSHETDNDNSLRHKDIDAPQFLKLRVASHAYHTFVPTVGLGLNPTQRSNAKVKVHTKTEFWFAFPSER